MSDQVPEVAPGATAARRAQTAGPGDQARPVPRRVVDALSDMPAVQALDHTRLPDDDPRLPERPSSVAAADALGATAVAYLITGPMLFGGIGYAIERWLGWGLAPLVGLLVGMALSVYLIWFRYGSS